MRWVVLRARPSPREAFAAGGLRAKLGYLFARLRDLGWGTWQIIVGSALLRGTYHLYQGFGGFVGNLVMGLVLGLVYLRWRRVGPLVVAHTLLDVVAFVGYALVASRVDWL